MDFLNVSSAPLDAHSSSRASASPLSSPPPNIMSQSDDDDEVKNWDTYDNHPSDGNLYTEALRDIDAAHSTYRTRQKLQAVVDTLKQVRWSFTQFIHAWMNESCELKHRRYRTLSQRRKALQQTLVRMPSNTYQLHLASMFTVEKYEAFPKPGPGDEKSIAFSIYKSSDSTNLLRMWRTIRSWTRLLKHPPQACLYNRVLMRNTFLICKSLYQRRHIH
jgi:hypothetical protein